MMNVEKIVVTFNEDFGTWKVEHHDLNKYGALQIKDEYSFDGKYEAEKFAEKLANKHFCIVVYKYHE